MKRVSDGRDVSARFETKKLFRVISFVQNPAQERCCPRNCTGIKVGIEGNKTEDVPQDGEKWHQVECQGPRQPWICKGRQPDFFLESVLGCVNEKLPSRIVDHPQLTPRARCLCI